MQIQSYSSIFGKENIFKTLSSLQLYTTTKQNLIPYIQFQVKVGAEEKQKETLLNLNINLYNLRQNAEKLLDNSLFGITNLLTVVSSNENIVRGSTELTNSSDFIPRVVSLSAAEITGNDWATENSRLYGIFGELIIEGERVTVGSADLDIKDSYVTYDSLRTIKNKINSLSIPVKAEIVDQRLVLTSTSGRKINFVDKTKGRKGRGLGLRNYPVREETDIWANFFTGNTFSNPVYFGYVQKVHSFSAATITGNESATVDTPLYGVSGKLVINGKEVTVDGRGLTNSLRDIAERINLIPDIGVSAYLEDNRLVLKSFDYLSGIQVQDLTSGGFAGGGGGLGLSRVANSGSSDKTASSYVANFQLEVLSLAQKQRNISYSVQDITGNPNATEDTPLGLSGYLEINGTKIYLYPTLTLSDINTIINNLNLGVDAYLNNGQLLLEANSPASNVFSLIDATSGGQKDGLGIGKNSKEVVSLSLPQILGNRDVDSNTYLSGITGTLEINGERLEIGIIGSTDTLARIVESINLNSSVYGVYADIVDNQLKLVSNDGSPIELKDWTTGGYAGGEGAFGFVKSSATIQRGQNAVYRLNDNLYSSPSNMVKDGVGGITFVLTSTTRETDGTELTVSTQVTNWDNVEKIKETISSFVNNFNLTAMLLNQSLSLNTEKGGGVFYQNQGLKDLQLGLKKDITSSVNTGISGVNSLEQIGIEIQNNGKENGLPQLLLNEEKLEEKLISSFSEVMALFNTPNEGIAYKIYDRLKGLVYNDGIPGIDIKERLRFTVFKPSRLPVNIGTLKTDKTGSLLDLLE